MAVALAQQREHGEPDDERRPCHAERRLKFVRWRPAIFMWPSRRRPQRTASDSHSQSFDWLCEQGHAGLERVAKGRRDATLIRPVTAALELLGAIHARLKGDVSVL